VFYIDADCLIRENVEEVFELDTDFAAAPDVFPPDKFNAGVMLIRPSLATFNSLLKAI
jgi:glycogenin glucosyltransferase